jgi:hypothetical protein
MTDITKQLAEALEECLEQAIGCWHNHYTQNTEEESLRFPPYIQLAQSALDAYRAQPQPVGEDVKEIINDLRAIDYECLYNGFDAPILTCQQAAALIERLQAQLVTVQKDGDADYHAFGTAKLIEMLKAQLSTARADALAGLDEYDLCFDCRAVIRNLKDTP